MFSFLVICLEALRLTSASFDVYYSETFIFAVILFFAFYSCIGHLFEIYVSKRVSDIFSILPSALLYFLLSKTDFPHIGVAAIIAAILRIAIVSVPKIKTVIMVGSFVLCVVALYLHFQKNAVFVGKESKTLLFVFLLILVLSAIQKILCEQKEAFPFLFFMILGLIVLAVPKPETPIDWSKALEAGNRFISSFNYYMPDIFGNGTYKTGYSNLGVTGGKVSLSDSTQLTLRILDRPYYVYEDDKGTKRKRRRVVYLSGGRGSEKAQIVSFVNFLYRNNVDKDTARLFSEINSMEIEYEYLKTQDEIAPLNALKLETLGKKVEGGTGKSVHKKGYDLNVTYMNIDYGSPYLERLIRQETKEDNYEAIPYEEAVDYFRRTYGPNLSDYVSKAEYDSACKIGFSKEMLKPYLETKGASDRIKELSKELTYGLSCDYDKCRAIEAYLRQYKYSTDVESIENTTYDMNTSEGASALSERFLFETGEGYCIHYTSSMIMLLRLSGIPARVSVGYHYMFPFDKENSYDVSGRCAHAWPEAYIENVGWVPFEPTSAYRSQEENTWNRVPVEESISENYGYVPSYVPIFTSLDIPETTEQSEEESLARELVRVVLPAMGSAVMLLLILVLGTKAVYAIRYKMASLDKKLEMDVTGIKKVVRKKSANSFTDRGLLFEYVKRIPSEFQTQAKEVFGAYYRLIYGGDDILPITEEDVKKARELYGALSSKNNRLK